MTKSSLPTLHTTIVRSVGGTVRSVRARAGWMSGDDVGAYLAGLETLVPEGTVYVFARVTLYSDVGETDGDTTKAEWVSGRWRITVGL